MKLTRLFTRLSSTQPELAPSAFMSPREALSRQERMNGKPLHPSLKQVMLNQRKAM